VAEVVVAEIAPDRGAFPSARHLASWARAVPGLSRGRDLHPTRTRCRSRGWARAPRWWCRTCV